MSILYVFIIASTSFGIVDDVDKDLTVIDNSVLLLFSFYNISIVLSNKVANVTLSTR